MPSSGSASRISTAARHARSASSSCATGTPNTAITASPMNFSTVPPCDSTIPRIRSKYRASSARNASGSVDSPSAVDPVTSQNSTVTVFRCSWLSPASGAVQNPQNWNPSGFSLPQAGQAATARVYDHEPSRCHRSARCRIDDRVPAADGLTHTGGWAKLFGRVAHV